MAALVQRLPALLAGREHPRDITEQLALAQLCYETKHYAAAARFWGEALEVDPKLGDNRQASYRYNGACAAALAASGQAKDETPPDAAATVKLRRLALDWLNADLGAWVKLLDAGTADIEPRILSTLQHWKVDVDLAGVRDPAALDKLVEAERKAWKSLWADVDALLNRVEKPAARTAGRRSSVLPPPLVHTQTLWRSLHPRVSSNRFPGPNNEVQPCWKTITSTSLA
jgi:pimeloyl-ACP methyl ester carboxylesterase